MIGSFSELALEQFARLIARGQASDFTENDTYDFTRCVRPNGSAYGTGGTCRKGKEGEKTEEGKTKKTTTTTTKTKTKKKKKEELNPKSQEERISPYSHLNGKNVDRMILDNVAEMWRRDTGLTLTGKREIDENIKKHDRVHVLLHEFLGGNIKGRAAIGEWLGIGRGGPTAAEEALVSRIHEAARAKERGGKIVKLSDEELGKKIAADLEGLKGVGAIDSKELQKYYASGRPNVDMFVKKFREFESSPHYEKLLDAANVAFPNYPIS